MERQVPVLKTDASLIEQEFDSIKEKFELEMRKMESEMSRFRSELVAAESRRLGSTNESLLSAAQTHKRSSSIRTTSRSTKVVSSAPSSSSSGWLNELDSPLIKETEDGARMLRLRFDVSDYKPEQIVVKTQGDRLQVEAHKEEKTESSSCSRHYSREFLLPRGLNAELIRSSLSADGVLTVEAPL